MRGLLVSACFCVVLTPAAQLSAQSPSENPHYESAKPTHDRMRAAHTQRLIHQRSLHRARERVSRIETRQWLGQSTLRPSVGYGHYYHPWFSYGGYYGHWWR